MQDIDIEAMSTQEFMEYIKGLEEAEENPPESEIPTPLEKGSAWGGTQIPASLEKGAERVEESPEIEDFDPFGKGVNVGRDGENPPESEIPTTLEKGSSRGGTEVSTPLEKGSVWGGTEISTPLGKGSGSGVAEISPHLGKGAGSGTGAQAQAAEMLNAGRSDPYRQGADDGRYARLMQHIKEIYPEVDDDTAVQMFLDEADKQAADAEGIPVEQYRQDRQDRAEFAEFKAERERKAKDEENVRSIVDGWREDSKVLAGIVPEFDFEKAMENGQFRDKVLKEGKRPITAYFELNPINKPPEKSSRRDIEVGDMSGGISGGFKSAFDVARASKEDFDDYIKKILDSE